MKLYIYDHCPYCVKARMIFGIKNIPVEIIILQNDDETTPISMIGKKMVPILQKEDGTFMPESMDIVHYIDQNYGKAPVVKKINNSNIEEWLTKTKTTIFTLAKCRWIKANLKEFETEEAINYFTRKKENYEGEFYNNMLKTSEYIKQINKDLKELNSILYSEKNAVSSGLSDYDFHLFASLRALSVVKEIDYPVKVAKYTENMSKKSKVPLHTGVSI